ncbi:hypothetical protein Acr_18g0004450 [Actinidia rufa]|uniref:Uncharacterized protein n=1 Tax=Actinidia rufa TaxID=165716 RepID=A0A7J0G651_9ERIC|nr:hypothetical protein Acr_18g0004450 [Actinidia rufa]
MAPMAANGPVSSPLKDEIVPIPALSSGGDSSRIGNSPGTRRVMRHHHLSDKSVVGGDVILGGFATALVAAIFYYLRVTRSHQHTKTEP